MSKIGFVFSERYLEHDTGAGHPERAARLSALIAGIEGQGLQRELERIAPRSAKLEWIGKVHDSGYVARVQRSCEGGIRHLDSTDTVVCHNSYRIALQSAGGVLAGIDAVMTGRINKCFCAVRPPGHHAELDHALGFCLFNNIAIGTRYAQEKYSVDRVAIVDWDVHHGNGTQNAFYKDPTVFFCSLHQFPHYPGTGSDRERGAGDGHGFTLNLPMPAFSDDGDYLAALESLLLPQLRDFQPELMMISAGFDAHQADPLSGTSLTEEGFAAMTNRLGAISMEFCHGRIVSVLEGGYNLEALASSVVAHLTELMELE